MMNENNINKINELLANEDFAKKIIETASSEKAYALFVEAGVTASYDEFMEYINSCYETLKEQGLATASSELGEDALDQVSGGANPGFGAYVWWTLGAVCIIAGGPAGASALLIGAGVASGTVNTLKKNKK